MRFGAALVDVCLMVLLLAILHPLIVVVLAGIDGALGLCLPFLCSCLLCITH